jgi:putative zincin peptidase
MTVPDLLNPTQISGSPLELPPGYVCQGDLFADFADLPAWRWFWSGNLLALLPLGLCVLVLWLPYQFYAALGTPLAVVASPGWPQWGYWLFGIIAVIFSMALHECLHGLALAVLGYRPRLGFSGGYFFATVRPGQFLTRNRYLTMVLTPIIAMTLGGGALLLFLPASLGQIIVIVLLLNAAASVGDLAVADRTRRWPSNARFAEAGGIKIFLPNVTKIA